MSKILDEILKSIPKEARITSSFFEGANIILYSKDIDFIINDNTTIKELVNNFKKRIEVRPDPSVTLDIEKAEIIIRKLIPEEAKIDEIIFDPQRSIVVIEAEKPGLVIGKQGDLLREIKKQTLWIPLIKRTPPIKSKIIDNIRHVLYENNDYRKKFLNKIGERIYDGWLREKKHEWVRLSCLGGGRQVGRSCLFLQTPESRILIDCGINTAAQEENAFPYLDAPEFKIEELDAIICTHAHLDHGGLIPWLYKMGYRGPLYCTEPTRDVIALLALDYIGVAYKEAKKTLFTSTDIKEMVKHAITLNYEEVTDITPDVRLTLYNAGHAIGSSMVHLHVGNGLHNLLITGDFKYGRTQLLEPASSKFPRLETLIIESTYGAKEDIVESRKEAEQELIDIVKKTVSEGGKVLIPVLGVGRSQEILLILEQAIRTGTLEKIPIYVQGLVWDVTAIHTAYPDYLNKVVRKSIFHKDANPFLSEIFIRVGSRKEQQELLEEAGPCVIMATAGMLNAGASVEYFKELAPYPKNSLIFVSYLGEGSLGRRVQNGEKEILFNDNGKPEVVKVNMNIHTIRAFTGHSDRNELMRFVYDVEPKPKKVIINHGESSKCLELASTIHKTQKIETVAPKNLEAVRIK